MGEGNDLATELTTDEGGFGLTSRTLGGLPIVNHVLDRLGLPTLLDEALGEVDGQSTLTPAAAIRLVITNLVLGREPLYALGEWAARFDPALLAMAESEVAAVNDDRVGRALDGLFDADRAHLLTAVMLRAISEFSGEHLLTAQRPGVDQRARCLPQRRRHRASGDGDPGHHSRALQGPPPRPQGVGLDPHRQRRWGRPDHLPPRGWQHRR